MRTRVCVTVVVGLVCVLGAASSASGDGGPGAGVSQGWDGVVNGKERYVAVPTIGWTSIQAISRDGGRVLRWLTLKGSWGIPVVAYDGTAGGLLPDRRTLVLADVKFGPYLRKISSFAFVDTKKMRVLERVRIPGHQTFDAVSPDARYLYLVEYVSAQDFTRYRVRAYDMKAHRLLPKIVSDRRSWETTMQGMPVSRETSPDGGWAFTLYGGTKARPFIHALDTRHVQAVCIDLPWRTSPRNIFGFRLRLDGDGHLVVRGKHGRALATIDRQSFRVLTSVRNP
jgi:hypothetical protein